MIDPATQQITTAGIMFEQEFIDLRRITREIAARMDMITWLKTPPAALARYDLRKSIDELRDAATRLEELIGTKPVWAEAAE